VILRDYQQRAVDAVLLDPRPVCVVAPTGAGKTHIGTALLSQLPGPALWLVHRRELLVQANRMLQAMSLRDRVTSITVQSLFTNGRRPFVETIIVDECFVAGTPIDGVPIEQVRVGDEVSAWDDRRACLSRGIVTRTFLRPAHALVRVTVGTTTLHCTPDHPFLTPHGYVPASRLSDDMVLCTVYDLQAVRHTAGNQEDIQGANISRDVLPAVPRPVSFGEGEANRSETPSGARHDTTAPVREMPDLCGHTPPGVVCAFLSGVPKPEEFSNDATHQPQGFRATLGAHDQRQPDDERRSSRQAESDVAGDGVAPAGSRWERLRAYGAAITTRVATWMGHGGSVCDGAKARIGISPLLQGGHREPNAEDRHRSGRQLAQDHNQSSARPQAGPSASWTRVDRVEVLEPGSDGTFGGVCPDGLVYNLEVAGHTYTAAGVVVHNCHHYAADEWSTVPRAYPDARLIGLTATPERSDGRPLGDMFSRLIVAAHYSELLEQGVIVPCRMLRPSTILRSEATQSWGLAQDEVAAYQAHGEGRSGFVYVPRISKAVALAAQFVRAGISALAISTDTDTAVRDAAIAQLVAGHVRLLVNVYALTEGVDVPSASLCLLARGVGHVSPYLQMVGRVLRASPGKTEALLLDLPGVSHLFGAPTDDRVYALSGQGISRAADALTTCLHCGATYEPGPAACPRCGFVRPFATWHPLRIYDVALEAVYRGAATDDAAKAREYQRLRAVATARGFSAAWVQREYRRLFGIAPVVADAGVDERAAEWQRLQARGRAAGYKAGWAAVRYKQIFGTWPGADMRR
jgi:superfamily II DNA or RNA helicase